MSARCADDPRGAGASVARRPSDAAGHQPGRLALDRARHRRGPDLERPGRFRRVLARRGRRLCRLHREALAPLVIGEPARSPPLWRAAPALTGRRGGMLIEWIAGIDIALWDLAGKAAGLPVAAPRRHGATRSRAYAISINWLDDAASKRGRGGGRGRFPASRSRRAPVAAAVDRVRLVRRLVGDDMASASTPTGPMTSTTRSRVGRA